MRKRSRLRERYADAKSRCRMEMLYESVCRELESSGLYLDPKLKLCSLAQAVSSNRTYISKALRYKAVSFPELVNSYRARHAVDLIIKNDCRGIRMEELAEQSGFNSAKTMNRYVKKSTGVSACALITRLYGKGRTTVQP